VRKVSLKIVAIMAAALLLQSSIGRGAEVRVAAVQFRSSFDIGSNCQRIISTLKRLAAQGVKVAVFPECALTGYQKGPVVSASASEIASAERAIQDTCRTTGIAVVLGSVYKIHGHAYDTAVVIDSNGEVVERYGKLFLAGEQWATPGNHISFFDLAGIPSTVMICHDERYPELVRLPAIAGARVVYYISSESPLSDEQKLRPYRAQIMARAVENGVFVVQANTPSNPDSTGSHGQSRIVAPDGNVRQEASFFGDDVLIDTLDTKPGVLLRPLNGPFGTWWKQGLDAMLQARHKQLD
jgi:predicted amidohydrolase